MTASHATVAAGDRVLYVGIRLTTEALNPEQPTTATPPIDHVHFVGQTGTGRLGAWFILACIATLVGVIVVKETLPPSVFPFGLLCLVQWSVIYLSQYCAMWTLQRQLRRRLRCVGAKTISQGPTDARAHVLTTLETAHSVSTGIMLRLGSDPSSPLDQAAEILRKSGHAGTVLRLSKNDTPTDALAPLTTEFQPVPLAGRAPELLSAELNNRQPPAKWPMLLDLYAHSTARPPTGRTAAIAGLVFMVVGFGALLGIGCWEMLQGQSPDMAYILPLYVALLAAPFTARLLFPRQWLAVPGGLIVRTSTWRSAKWQVHLLRRDECVLIHWVDANILAVAGGEGRHFSWIAKPAVAEFAIRAWLSPLEPPAAEQLSDLT